LTKKPISPSTKVTLNNEKLLLMIIAWEYLLANNTIPMLTIIDRIPKVKMINGFNRMSNIGFIITVKIDNITKKVNNTPKSFEIAISGKILWQT
jgi:hypothetical protein